MVKSIKNIFMLVFVIALSIGCVFCFSACGKSNNDKINIVCTIFPEYDWVREIVGEQKDNFEITLLMSNGADLHNYQPTVADIAQIASADVFIYVGGESDKWVDNALKNATNKNMIVLNLMDILGDKAKEEVLKEGMEETEHEEGEEHEEEHEEEVEYDEHVWLSLKNTQIFINKFAEKIGEIDTANKQTYQANATAYITKLNNLDLEYQQAVNTAPTKTLLFGDRFPFRYLVDDYNLDYFAAFVGCSAETEASFETITFLAKKVDDLGLKVILKIETSSDSIAKTIRDNTSAKNQQILTLDSMQSTTLKSNKTYLQIMTSNLQILKEAIK